MKEGPLLGEDEWIGFQIKEGPCNQGCDYCYERATAFDILSRMVGQSEMSRYEGMDNRRLAEALKEFPGRRLEMRVDELQRWFSILEDAGIKRAFLIGSEPTEHSGFESIVDKASESGLELLVYTSGKDLRALFHPSVKYIVLHMDHGKDVDRHEAYFAQFMDSVNQLLNDGKEIHMRMNFSDEGLSGQDLVFNFFDGIDERYRPDVMLKYSFSSRVRGAKDIKYFNPGTMKETVPNLLVFIDEFKERYPDSPMYAERPLFPCTFGDGVWDEYKEKGGLTSTCRMEFVVYSDRGITLCPPAKHMIDAKDVRTGEGLKVAIQRMKERIYGVAMKPSFHECGPCERRVDLSCQGGCLGYKDA
ncbi:MAG: radical SAM protein [Nanoarchaeota archaeon]|nr:radical SAM protein [Nanoarchaeota archaeon]